MISSRNVANPTVNIKSKLISQILPRRVVCSAIARWAWSAMIVESEPVPHSRDSSPGLSQPVKRTASSSSSCSDVAFMTGLCRHRAGYPRAFPCQCLSEWFIFREGDRPQIVELECEQFFELTWSYVPPKLCGTVPNSVPQFILKKPYTPLWNSDLIRLRKQCRRSLSRRSLVWAEKHRCFQFEWC